MKTKTSYNGSLQRQGPYEEYYEGGQVKTKCSYVRDTLEGPFASFHQDGSPEVKAFIWRGHKVGPSYYYDDSGKLRTYNEFDYNNGAYYVIKYGKDSKVIKEEGVAISPILLIDNNMTDSLPRASSAEINFFFAEPEGYTNSLQCTLNGNPVDFRRLEGHVGSIELSIPQHSIYHLKILSTLRRPDQSIFLVDSIVKTVRSFR